MEINRNCSKCHGEGIINQTPCDCIKEAIKDIVIFNTLPPQIDYVKPWQIKFNNAVKFLESLPKDKSKIAFKEIDDQILEYYNSDIARYDSLF